MIPPRQQRIGNYRRANSRTPQSQDILEVRVRRRIVQQQRNRRVLRMVAKVALVVVLIAAGIFGGREGLRHFLWENPKYRLAVVELHNDGAALTREMVLTTAGLEIGTNVFRINLGDARQALLELPQVESVDLHRVLPNKISISLSERRPIAWLADRDEPDATAAASSFLIDTRGTLFKPKRQVPEYLRLPVIYGIPPQNYLSGERVETPELQAALELITLNSAFNRFHFRSIDLSKGYCMDVIDARRAKITFGIDNIAGQLDRLNAIYDYITSRQQEIQMVNLLVERNVPVRLGTPPTEEELLAEARKGIDKEERDVAESEASAPVALTGKDKPVSSEVDRDAEERDEAAAVAAPKPVVAQTPRKEIARTPSRPARTRTTAKASPTPRRATTRRPVSEPKAKPTEPPVRRAIRPGQAPEIRRAIPVSAVITVPTR